MNAPAASSPAASSPAASSPAADSGCFNAAAAEQIAESLAAVCRHVVLAPGSRSTPLAIACEQHPALEVHVVLDERVAAFLALGLSRASGHPSALVCTSGSAAAHFLPAVLEAHHARVPLLILSADRPPEAHHCGAPQTVDQSQLFSGQLRFRADLPVPDEALDRRWLRNLMARALAAATDAPAGPVQLNVPFREPLLGVSHSAPLPACRVLHGRRILTSDAVEQLAARLSGRRGLIACGPLAPASQDPQTLASAVSKLAQRLRWPVLADPASGLRFGRHHSDHILGHYDAFLSASPAARDNLAPEIALQIGLPPTSKALRTWLSNSLGEGTILLDADGCWLDPTSAATSLVVAEPAPLLDALRPCVEPVAAAWLKRWQDCEKEVEHALIRRPQADVFAASLARTLVEQLPDGAQLHLASSMAIREVDAFVKPSKKRLRLQANRGCNGIDGTIATAIGEALAWSDGPTVALLGDLAFFHDVGALAAASQLQARLTLVVFNNDGGGIFSYLPIAEQLDQATFERLFATPQAHSIAAICEGLQLQHDLAEPANFGHLLCQRQEEPGLKVIELRLDRQDSKQRRQALLAEIGASSDARFGETR